MADVTNDDCSTYKGYVRIREMLENLKYCIEYEVATNDELLNLCQMIIDATIEEEMNTK